MDYGFRVGDRVVHVKDQCGETGTVVAIDDDYDHGGVTTCEVLWSWCTDVDIRWTNKLILAE